MSKWVIFCLFFCVLLITAILCLGNKVLADVNDPMAPPPEKNTPAFLNISGEYQIKRGALRLGTDDVTSPFNYQLEVVGEGAKISNVIADENLKVSNTIDTLFVDAANNKVCLGPCLNIAGTKLEVSGYGMIVNGDANTGIFAVSSDSEAIYGIGTTYGVQGLSSGTDNYGIWAVSVLGTAVEGVNQSYSYSSVYGQSDTGYGIYGTNTNPASLWAGYFVGRVESNSDVSGAKFVPTQLQSSLVPYTSGQVSDSYTISNTAGDPIVKYYDGTYLWIIDDSRLHKVRATDGFKIFDVAVGANPTDVIFDGNYIWVTVGGGEVQKIDPYSGIEECSLAVTNPQSITFDSQHYWVTAEDGDGNGVLAKMDSACTQIGGNIDLTTSSFSLGKIIYNGSYLWALATNDDTGVGSVVNINPSTNDAMRWDGLIGSSPSDIFFDNYYYWVTSTDSDSVTRYYLSESKVCSQLDNDDPVACQTDIDCSAGGFGTCLFVVPQSFGTHDTGDEPAYMAFDGTYIWAANVAGQSLTRLLAADPSQTTSFTLGFTPTGLLFDGTYLWISSSTGLTKMYSGSGYGSTDLRDTLTLQFNSPLIQQDGSIDISGSGKIGGNVTGGWELTADYNVWGTLNSDGSDVIAAYGWALLDEMPKDLPENSFPRDIMDLLEASDGYIYASSKYWGYTWRSNDDGDNWEELGRHPHNSDETLATLLLYGNDMIETSDGTIYMGTGDGTWKPSEGNLECPLGMIVKWDPIFDNGDGTFGAWVKVVDFYSDVPCTCREGVDNGNQCLINSDCAGFDDGTDEIWCRSNVGDVYSLLEVTVDTTDYLYAGTQGGHIFRSDNGFATSRDIATPAPNSGRVMSFVESSNGYVYAGTGGTPKTDSHIYRAESGTNTWEAVYRWDDEEVEYVHKLLEGSDGNLYAATGDVDDDSLQAHVYKSTDDGFTWTDTAPLPEAWHAMSLIEDDGVLYVGTQLHNFDEYVLIAHVYRSEDWGNTWEDTGTFIDKDPDPEQHAGSISSLLKASSGYIFAGADMSLSGEGRIFRSDFVLPPGTHSCPPGHFVKNVQYFLDTGQVSRIECRPL